MLISKERIVKFKETCAPDQLWWSSEQVARHIKEADEAVFEDWRPLFKDYFNLTPDFSKIVIPCRTPETQDYTRTILMPEELAKNEKLGFHKWLYNIYRQILGIPCRSHYDDLDQEVVYHDRHPKHSSYALYVRDLIEGDEEFAGLSAERIWKAVRKIETLAERLMHGLKVWHESKQHLDIKGVTLCAGSRDLVGNVSGVCWYDDALYGNTFDVGCCKPDSCDDLLRARAVVF